MKRGISTVLTICLTAVIALGIVAGGYYYIDKQNKDEKAAFQAQIDALNTELAAAKKTSTTATTTTATDETVNWKTYTSLTFRYSIKYPTAWTEKQGRVLETGVSEDSKNMSIEFYNSDTLMLRIVTDYKTKVGDPNLATLAAEKQPPMDKTTISGAVAYKIGSLDGYRRLVVVSDPVSHGLEYITKDSKYVYHMSTFADAESAEIVNMLKTFTAN